MHNHIRSVVAAAATSLVLILSGCGSASDPEPSSPPSVGPSSRSSVSIPQTTAGQAMIWVHEILEQEEDVTEADLEDRFLDEFIAQVSLEDLTTLFNTNLRPAAPFTVSDYAGEDLNASATFAGEQGDPFVVQIVVTSDGTITGLLFTPDIDHEAATSLDEVESRLDDLPMDVNYIVTREGETLASQGADDVAPIGSAFKLWVLLAVVEAVESGDLNWDDELTVTEANKSLPSGELQDEPDGTTVTVREAAQKMIEISDNTATDLLIGAVGRDSIDALVPEHMRPVATTRQFFELVWGEDAPQLTEDYASADTAGRAAILDDLTELTVDVTGLDLTTSEVSSPTWAASPQEVAGVLDQLVAASDEHPEIGEILGANTGVPVEGYENLWFKGGSLPGVVAGAWTGQTESGERVSVILIAGSDDATAISDHTMELLLLGGDALTTVADGA
ncbi:MAG: serine hydrolase [Ancrocorticia sp.]|uniref:serine hydrolase n=1 Tax=Ancrocorticia sp. TaxID=2593684 RepID=UPI003F8FE263